MDTTYLIDNYVAQKPGEPYRLFPFGKIVKNGKTRTITPEYAAQFKLPHFRPAVKLGSHDDIAPAGGHIVGLEVRGDGNCSLCQAGECKEHGLFCFPEWTEKGGKATAEGDFLYHSPEVLWEDGAIENPTDGSMINGPLVLGDALLHMPHLGEATALYSIEPITEDKPMTENVTIPQNLWDKFIAPLFAKEPEKIEVVTTVEPEDYAATKQERDELKAQIEKQNADAERSARVDKFGAELKETKADPGLSELLADLPAEQADAIMKQFKALSAQIDEAGLTGERGTEGGAGGVTTDDPQAAFNARVLALSQEKGLYYHVAFDQVKREDPELFKAAFPKK